MELNEIIKKAKHLDIIKLPGLGRSNCIIIDKKENCLRDGHTGESIRTLDSGDVFSDEWEFCVPVAERQAMRIWVEKNEGNYCEKTLSKAGCFCLGYKTALEEVRAQEKHSKKEV